jgi:hypothetical protein
LPRPTRARQIDRRAEVVALAFDRRAVIQADAHGGRAMPAHQLVRDPQSQENRLRRIGDAQHHRVADRLDRAAAGGR